MNVTQISNFIFPPPNAPDVVKTAWEKSTSSMSGTEKMLATGMFLGKQCEANFWMTSNGNYLPINVEVSRNKSVFGTTKESYNQIIMSMISDYKGYLVTGDPAVDKQIKEKINFLTLLKKALNQEGR